MKNFLLFFFITILFSSSMHAKRTGCDGECENGTGTWTYTDQTVYTGEWVNSKKQGRGIETWPNGYVYEGEFFNILFYYNIILEFNSCKKDRL